MNIKQFIFQDEDDNQKLCNIVTIVNSKKNNSLYLVYTEENNENELLYAKINNDLDELFLENINIDELEEIENLLNERGNNNESRY